VSVKKKSGDSLSRWWLGFLGVLADSYAEFGILLLVTES